MFKIPEPYRVKEGVNHFRIPYKKGYLVAVVSTGLGWEHVATMAVIGGNQHTPVWQEMCFIKDLFWDKEDVVMQLHPKESEYVNEHPCVLHLWRPTYTDIPTPPKVLV